MTATVKYLRIAMWCLALATGATLLLLWRMSDSGPSRDVVATLPEFSLLDQDGRPFTRDSVAGKVWVADFVFTRCAGPCPMMTGKMLRVQTALANSRVKLVTFSVDPAYDTPDVLRNYGRQYSADFTRWTFVTGSEPAMQSLAKSLLIGIQPAVADQPIIHSTHFILVDRKGNVYGPYNGEDDEGWRELVNDARKLSGK